MKKTIALLLTTALLAACGKEDIEPEQVRQALPTAAEVQLQTAAAGDAGALTAPAVGDPAGYAHASFWTAATFNVATAWTLGLVHFITTLPPSECGDDTCTWGPWTDAETSAAWRLDVTRAGDGYDWRLAAHAAGEAEFRAIIEGSAFPGATRGRGHGEFTIDFDAGRAVNPASEDHGVLHVAYDTRSSARVAATFLGARNDDPQNPGSEFLDVAYDFQATATGGELQVAFETVDGPAKNLSLRTRWVAGGQGRGDARYVEGAVTYEGSQCWRGTTAGADAWRIAYERLVFGVTEIESGELDACGMFSSAVYSTLVLP